MSGIREDSDVITQSEQKVDVPKRYKVVILNDDYTSMEFVVYVLEKVFNKTPQAAVALMMAIHESGSGIAGVYSFEVAEMKVAIVTEMARSEEYPLRCYLEEE